MAGNGSRFIDAGYTLPKPLIKVFERPMIEQVVNSLNIDADYIFIVQESHRVKYQLDDVLDEIAPGCKVIGIDGVTDGAARTTLYAKSIIDNDTPLIIANSDQVIVWDSFAFKSLLEASYDVIALFHATETKWSFSKIRDERIIEVAEKKPISNAANVGIYGWAKGSDYVKYAEQMIDKNIKTNNEFYVAPVYNEAIASGNIVLPFFVDEMHGLGTPEDLERFLDDSNK